jgi:phosphate transport system permease protein
MTSGLYGRRRASNVILLGLSLVATMLGLTALGLILFTLVDKGLTAFDFRLFTEMTPPPGESGGLLNAIAGTLAMTSIAVVVGTPLGMLAGTYVAEHGRHTRFALGVRFINDILLSAPSIVIGLFIYELMIIYMGIGFSGWAGAAALTVIVVPVVLRTTEGMLLLIPNSLREAAAALGAPRSHIIRQVTWRAARAGIITGALLAIARISGETAPLLFTALGNNGWTLSLEPPNFGMDQPMASLPQVIFAFANSPYEDWKQLAWAGALLITMAVLFLSVLARVIEARSLRRMK